MNRLFLLIVPVALAGCVEGVQSAMAPADDRVYTVDEFLAQPELRKKYFTACGNDPGRTERDPNCINVLSAERIASAGMSIPRTTP
jgi:hypothetical protein